MAKSVILRASAHRDVDDEIEHYLREGGRAGGARLH